MNVCLITVGLDVFRGGNHLPLLSACKDTTFVILTNRTKPKDPQLPDNIKVITLNERIGPFYYGCADWLFARAVLSKYPPSDPFWKQFDLIHLNQTIGMQFLKLQKSGTPVLYTVHHPATADLKLSIKESGFFSSINWRFRYALLVYMQKKLCRRFPKIVTVSNTAADRIANDYGCNRNKIKVAQNGVDGEMFPLAETGEPEFSVIVVGSLLHPRKGFKYLVQVYRALAAKGYRIVDVGRRSDEQVGQLKEIDGVTMYGTILAEQLLSLMQSSAVLISTSIYEGFGLTLIEALSCGRPAIAFAAGAVPEVLNPIDPTLVVPLRDTDAMVKRVEEFLMLPLEEREQKGKEYRKKVLELYSIEQAAEALQAVYRDTMKK